MNIHIETDRLILRDMEEYDVEGIFALDSDPDVHEYLGKNPITTMKQAREVIDYVRNQYKKHGIGRWAVIDKKTNDFIGWSGLKFETTVREEFDYYDLGYRFRKKYWGKGIATETAIASLKYGFEKLKLDEISGAADVDNLASNKILQKVGLKYVETFNYEGIPHHWYTLKRSEWLEINSHH
ncbi:MAG: GNAT family N-acetyltransferase [Bacteroidia bacterium]|nr:GNAT family N-acetyltransferase [Bacteroidia bacterium]NNF32411.1 GNAT family N-acetyltransferase [Flavobacteriaceae bacterium]NNJ82415.1 GNAT family N-acetyltransferase [Flavobacteriaceae bacterium]NNK55451.1 GNAT family N-acetyltransferase [Flavobacteriaceae bacterium]